MITLKDRAICKLKHIDIPISKYLSFIYKIKDNQKKVKIAEMKMKEKITIGN